MLRRSDLFFAGLSQLYRYLGQALLLLIVANYLGPADFGVFIVGFTLATFVNMVVDYGLNQKVVVDLCSASHRLSDVLTSDLLLKAALSVTCAVLVWALIQNLYAESTTEFLYLTASGALFSFSNYFLAICRAKLLFWVEALVVTLYYLILAIAVIALYVSPDSSILEFSRAFFYCRLAFFVISIFAFWLAHKREPLSSRVELNDFAKRGGEALPFALLGILAFAYLYFDTFLIDLILGGEDVAKYQAAFRIMMLFMIGPEILNSLMLPRLSKVVFIEKRNSMWYLLVLTGVMFAFGLLATGFLLIVGEFIVVIGFGLEFVESTYLLYWLTPVLVLRCLGAPLSAFLTVCGRLWFRVGALIVVTVGGIILNAVFLGLYGIKMAIVTSVLIHLVLNAIYLVGVIRSPEFKNSSIAEFPRSIFGRKSIHNEA